MAASGWLSSWLSNEAISPTVASRAVACRRSCEARDSSSTRRCSLMSRNALIQPVCWPWALMSGASMISTGNRVPSLRMNSDSNPSRGGIVPAKRTAWRWRYSSTRSGGQ